MSDHLFARDYTFLCGKSGVIPTPFWPLDNPDHGLLNSLTAPGCAPSELT
jgi:hypothetical protein